MRSSRSLMISYPWRGFSRSRRRITNLTSPASNMGPRPCRRPREPEPHWKPNPPGPNPANRSPNPQSSLQFRTWYLAGLIRHSVRYIVRLNGRYVNQSPQVSLPMAGPPGSPHYCGSRLRFTRIAAMLTPIVVLTSLLPAPAVGLQGSAGDTLPVTVFEDVNVVPMDRERVLEAQTVVIRGGRIAEVGARGSVPIPETARRIDGRGKYLMPGIAEMHAHVPAADDPLLETAMALYVLNGATTIRAMMGTPDQLDFRRRIA